MPKLDNLLSFEVDVPKLVELHSGNDELLVVDCREAEDKFVEFESIELLVVLAVVEETVSSCCHLGDEDNRFVVCWQKLEHFDERMFEDVVNGLFRDH